MGLPIPFTGERQKALQPVSSGRHSWFGGIIQESFAGAWQQNVEIKTDTVLTFSAVYACITLIAGDIGKLRLRLVAQDNNGIWNETENVAWSPVIRKPNRYQTRVKFIEQWIVSKLIHGNAYILKVRDQRGVVSGLYVLDPCNVKPLVSDVTGEVFYQLSRDDLSGLDQNTVVVPASEIIHDTMIPLFHPLVGVSPITACGLAAVQGIEIQKNSTKFFANGSRPGGILTAPGAISEETATRLKTAWETNFSGENAGKVAVLGDGLKYESMVISAHDSQLIEQLRWGSEEVARCFHVPNFKIGIGQHPTYQNAAVLNQIYYSDCLQTLIENAEALLDEGLDLPKPYGVEFDLDDLMRMDMKTQVDAYAVAVGSALMSPNEGRRKINLPPKQGGDSPYLQQQNYSLAALAKRDAQSDPFGSPQAPAQVPPSGSDPDDSDEEEMGELEFGALLQKSVAQYDTEAARYAEG
jgi:HK97 family phage portal protein